MATPLQRDGWIKPTQERLEEWGAVMRSVQMPDLGHDHRAAFVQVIPSAPIDSETAARIERYLLRIKLISPSVYQALFGSYYLQLPDVIAADRQRMSSKTYSKLRLVGEAMIRAYWDGEPPKKETRASLKKKFDEGSTESVYSQAL